DRDISFPRRLIEFAEDQKENPEISFDKERDKMIIVFDGDIFEEKVLDYDELVAEGEKNNILAVSNPAFELFLLLHYENSYEDDIEPNAEQIIQNEKDGHQTFIYKLLLARTGINPKKNSAIGELAEKVEIAIEQEKKINEDIHQCKGQITCNIGRIIDEIRKDGKRAYEYSYKLRNNFDSSYYQDIIISEIDKLYNRISFPVDNVDEDRYHTCYNIMYVLYHSDAEKFLQYCEKIKEDCDHMSRHRIEVLVEEIVKNRNKIYIARWFPSRNHLAVFMSGYYPQ
ncbi:MAG: RloB family protein, partial [Lachnospiraceae bacterium]